MDFEEKIDAMRNTLELAILDIEAQRSSTQELRLLSENQHRSIEELRGSIQELRLVSESHGESIQGLLKISERLVHAVDSHSTRIGALEGRKTA